MLPPAMGRRASTLLRYGIVKAGFYCAGGHPTGSPAESVL
jgi:hypothetical protein